MQVFSEPEMVQCDASLSPASGAAVVLNRRNSYEASQMGDNTYATIQPRSMAAAAAGHASAAAAAAAGQSLMGGAEQADYATLRNGSGAPSVSDIISLCFSGFVF